MSGSSAARGTRTAAPAPLPALLATLSAPEWRHHPWRQAAAVLAVLLGVALAFSVHLINASALSEFSAAVRAANGEPDLSLRAAQPGGFDDAVYERVATAPGVRVASPVVESQAQAYDRAGERVALKVVGVDALVVAAVAPGLWPRVADGEGRTAFLAPDAVFLNAAAQQRLGLHSGETLALQFGLGRVALRVAGTVAAGGPPLAVLDVAAAQRQLGFEGRLSRIDLRLEPGADAAALVRALALPADVVVASSDDATQRVSNLSRAYRVNLTVLALVALFVGAFLVFSVLALSVAQRTPQLALLGVLGLGARERRRLVLAESALVGVLGSALGLAVGTALAALALRWLAGDLGGGYFPGIAPQLQFSWPAAAVFGALGVVAALAGGWLPAWQAQALAPAQALKGLGGTAGPAAPAWLGPALLAFGGALALLPPWRGLPIAAYVSVAVLLLGGIACVPVAVGLVLARWHPRTRPLALLAVERARHERQAATIAVAGVVASLSLAVALTVMVASFRDGVARWLDTVLPADLYARSATTSAAADTAFLPPDFVDAVAALPGVARVEATRHRALQLDAQRPAVTLLVRPLADPVRALPLVDVPVPARTALPGAWVSEAMVALYDARPGTTLALPIGPAGEAVTFEVRGVWRDYARQFGAVTVAEADYQRGSGDTRRNDLAMWLAPGTDAAQVIAAIRALAPDAAALDFAQPGEIRAVSLRIFDRSFAVTYYLQAVAIGIGLFGVAASFSAQVLARRREFGLLVHLGLRRRQIVGVVAGEGLAWTAAGALVGLALGLAVAVVLVKVVNPQSFHWTMELLLPWARLAALVTAVGAAGGVTAALSARAAAGRDAVLAVKEDW
ncbi:FtsX-like permease family protein [Azohydromonas sediminis]|uniref:FtsX-like permease family protein n=1 Tax=Azohydromonas sediminis TaxID=2259674 RepID=UPI000E65ACE8|nr:ABC transporter permease [Azohydromonas sediminis]